MNKILEKLEINFKTNFNKYIKKIMIMQIILTKLNNYSNFF